MSKETVQTLLKIAADAGCEVLSPVIMEPGEHRRYENAPGCFHGTESVPSDVPEVAKAG